MPEAEPASVPADAPEGFVAAALDALQRLALLARRDEEARLALESLGRALAALAAAPPAAESAPAGLAADGTAPAAPPPSVIDMFRDALRSRAGEPSTAAASAMQAAAGISVAPVPSADERPRPVAAAALTASPERLDTVAARDLAAAFRTKHHAAEWAARERARNGQALPTIPPDIAGGLDHARQLWFCDPQSLHQRREQDYRTLSAAFLAAAEAFDYLDLAWQSAGERELFQPLQLIAEASSMIRRAVLALRSSDDPDQERTHRLLRQVTMELSVFIPRYMKLDDPADPSQADDLVRRVRSHAAPIRDRQDRAREAREARSSLDYHLEAIADPASGDEERHWAEALAAIETLVLGGVLRPSDKTLREQLLPLLERRPASIAVGPGVTQVLREIDRYLDSQEQQEAGPASATAHSADVRRVAEKLQGRSLVLIGGERRVVHEERLERTFGLRDILWIEGYGHSYTTYEPAIARPDVAAVLLAVRWASHESGNVQRYCEQYGKPLVMMRAGYNENQVAAQLIAQAGQRLGL